MVVGTIVVTGLVALGVLGVAKIAVDALLHLPR